MTPSSTMFHLHRIPNPSNGSETPTSGEVFEDGVAIELVRSVSGDFALLCCKGQTAEVVPDICISHRKYVPLKLNDRLAQNLLLPQELKPHGSARELLAELEQTLAPATSISQRARTLLATFALASWTPEILPCACSLVLDGDPTARAQVMRYMTPICRHAVLLGRLGYRELAALPIETLKPTVLALELADNLHTAQLLRTSSQPGALTLQGKEPQDIFCCKILPPIDVALPGSVIVALVSGQRIQLVANRTLQAIAEKLQPKLLSYRIETLRLNLSEDKQQRGADISAAHPVAAAVIGDTELQNDVIALLRDYGEESAYSVSGVHAIVIECCLAVCHEGKQLVEVNELALLVNATLTGRGEQLQVSNRKTGALLKALGLRTTAIKDVRGLELLEPLRRRIHQLALEYNVPTIRGRTIACPLCQKYWGNGHSDQAA